MNRPSDEPWEESPYKPPSSSPPPDKPNGKSQSVFDEPWMRASTQSFRSDGQPGPGPEAVPSEADPENSVWDEPGLSTELSGPVPQDAVTWLSWYRQQAAKTTTATTWSVTLAVALASGICAVLGALFLQLTSGNQVLAVVVAAPVTEEIMKVALAIWIVEKRPWLFRSATQILICGLVSGFVFAAIENVLYLGFGKVPPGLVAWRWTVCVALHVTCTLIASVGVAKVWSEFQRQQRMPHLSDGAAWIVAAMLIHGAYNFTVTILEATGFLF